MRSFPSRATVALEASSSQGFFGMLCLLLALDAWRSLFFTPVPEGTPHTLIVADGVVCTVAAGLVFGIGRAYVSRDVPRRAALVLGALCGVFFFARDLGCALLDPTTASRHSRTECEGSRPGERWAFLDGHVVAE